jgi:hypothetical protein
MDTVEKLKECKRLLEEVAKETQERGEKIWPATMDEQWEGRDCLYLTEQIKARLLGHNGMLEYYIKVVEKLPAPSILPTLPQNGIPAGITP